MPVNSGTHQSTSVYGWGVIMGRVLLTIVCGLFLVIDLTSLTVPDITGLYMSTGQNPNGSDYKGGVHIRLEGQVYVLTWISPAGVNQFGVGILTGDVLSVSYVNVESQKASPGGVIAYSILTDGRFVGEWTNLGKEKNDPYIINKEILTKVSATEQGQEPHGKSPREAPPPLRRFGVSASRIA